MNLSSDAPGIIVGVFEFVTHRACTDDDLGLSELSHGSARWQHNWVGEERVGRDQATERRQASVDGACHSMKLHPEELLQMHFEIDGRDDLLNGRLREGRCAYPNPRVSVIIPALDEEATITAAIMSASGSGIEVIVVDGGSTDHTMVRAAQAGARVIRSERGRARQMNAGAAVANGEFLVFLHADTTLPVGFGKTVVLTLDQPGVSLCAFELSIRAEGLSFRVIERLVNLRSRVFQMPYGDQALSMRSNIFREIGEFPDGPIMEDYALVRSLRRMGRIVITPLSVVTSARRWLRRGVWRTTLANQVYIVAYRLGVPLSRIARWREGVHGVTHQTQNEASPSRVHLDAPSFCDGE